MLGKWTWFSGRGVLLIALLQTGAAAQFDLLNWQLQVHGTGKATLVPYSMQMLHYDNSPEGSALTYSTHAPVAARVYVDMGLTVFDGKSGSSELVLSLNQVGTVLATNSTHKPLVFDVPAQASFGFSLVELMYAWPGAAGFSHFAFTPVPTTVSGPAPGDRLGAALANVGDVNGDGIQDLIAGMPNHAGTGPGAGGARLLSGADASVLFEFLGDAAGDQLGAAVCGAGDVDGDGVPDVIVGAPRNSAGGIQAGLARVFSGADGHVLGTFVGNAPGDQLGSAVAGSGDVDGDGLADLIVGAPHAQLAGIDSGVALEFSGASGVPLHAFVGPAGGLTGSAVAAIGDVNGDGHVDVGVGAPKEGFGTVRTWSGSDGALLRTFTGSIVTLFGAALADAGDLDSDGVDDLVVGQPGSNGRVHVFSGASGAEMFSPFFSSDTSECGKSVAGVGDVNGDGVSDYVAGSPSVNPGNFNGIGRAFVFSGRDGSVLWQPMGAANLDAFGSVVCGLGDRDADGVSEIGIGVPGLDAGGTDAGGVVFQDFFVNWFDLGQGLAGSAGVPSLAGKGLLFGETPVSITLSGAAMNAPAALVIGFSAIDAPLKGGVLVPAPDLVLAGLATGPTGGFSVSATWPSGLTSGLEFFVQACVPDAVAAHGLALSNALRAKTP